MFVPAGVGTKLGEVAVKVVEGLGRVVGVPVVGELTGEREAVGDDVGLNDGVKVGDKVGDRLGNGVGLEFPAAPAVSTPKVRPTRGALVTACASFASMMPSPLESAFKSGQAEPL
jgi:hypothetical protein